MPSAIELARIVREAATPAQWRWAASLAEPQDLSTGSRIVHEAWDRAAGPTIAVRAMAAARRLLDRPDAPTPRNLGNIPSMLALAGAPPVDDLAHRTVHLVLAAHVLGELEEGARERSQGSLALLLRDPDEYRRLRSSPHPDEDAFLARVEAEGPADDLERELAQALELDLARSGGLSHRRAAAPPRGLD